MRRAFPCSLHRQSVCLFARDPTARRARSLSRASACSKVRHERDVGRVVDEHEQRRKEREHREQEVLGDSKPCLLRKEKLLKIDTVLAVLIESKNIKVIRWRLP